jgi:hypothetical protein
MDLLAFFLGMVCFMVGLLSYGISEPPGPVDNTIQIIAMLLGGIILFWGILKLRRRFRSPEHAVTGKGKWILWSVSATLLAVVVFLWWGITTTHGTVRDSYGRRVAAALVMLFQEEHGRLPASWQELEPLYGDGRGLHHGGLSFKQVQERIVIEFSHLADLQALARVTKNAGSVPKVIYAKSGRGSYWENAEPNRMVYEYFVEHPQPGKPLEPSTRPQ